MTSVPRSPRDHGAAVGREGLCPVPPQEHWSEAGWRMGGPTPAYRKAKIAALSGDSNTLDVGWFPRGLWQQVISRETMWDPPSL